MNIANLPTDITRCIVDYVAHGVTVSLYGFSKALPILWVCREWRLLALAKIYSCAYLNVYTIGQFNIDDYTETLEADTNFELICRNKLQHLVTKLNIMHDSEAKGVYVRSLVNNIVQMGMSGIIPIIRRTQNITDRLARHIATASNDKNNEIDDSAEAAIVRTFQNVKCIDVYNNEGLSDNPTHIDALVAGYSKQLSSVKYCGQTVRLNLTPACNLTNLELDVCFDDKLSDLPFITPTNPQYLQDVMLKVIEQIPLCDLFFRNPNSNSIDFTNLRRLELVDAFYNYTGALEGINNFGENASTRTRELLFPVLVDLRIENYFRGHTELQSLLEAPLKRLNFFGYASHFIRSYKDLPSSLNHLIFGFPQDEINGNLVENLNRILARVRGIEAVELDIDCYICEDNIANISWSNLTHINLLTNNTFYDVLNIVDNAFDLVVFKFSMHQQHLNEIDQTIDFLLNIKQRFSRPSRSMVHTLVIITRDNLTNKPFRKALENLKWYWPNLQNIEFQKRKQ